MTVVHRAVLAGPTLDAARALLGAILVREPARGSATQVRIGRIVEVEAYLGPDDEASHARFGPGGRSAVMFGPPGIAYVYLVYGMYDALNVVTEPIGRAAAVLVRAVEPLEGIDAMRDERLRHAAARRRVGRARTGDGEATGDAATGDAVTGSGATGARAITGNEAAAYSWLATERYRLQRLAASRLTSGPGLIAAAFGIDRSFTGMDLCDPASPLRLEQSADVPLDAIVSGPRVGIGYAGEPWRSASLRFAIAGSPSLSRPSFSRGTASRRSLAPEPGD